MSIEQLQRLLRPQQPSLTPQVYTTLDDDVIICHLILSLAPPTVPVDTTTEGEI